MRALDNGPALFALRRQNADAPGHLALGDQHGWNRTIPADYIQLNYLFVITYVVPGAGIEPALPLPEKGF